MFPASALISAIFSYYRFIILMYAQGCVLKMGNILVCSFLCMFVSLSLNVFGLSVYFLIIIGWCMLEIWLDFLIGVLYESFTRWTALWVHVSHKKHRLSTKCVCVCMRVIVALCIHDVQILWANLLLCRLFSERTFFLYSLAIYCFANGVKYSFVCLLMNNSDCCLENCWCIWSPGAPLEFYTTFIQG